MAAGETTNPEIQPELTDRERTLVRAFAEAANGRPPWFKRYAPAAGFLVALGTIIGGFFLVMDSRYTTIPNAAAAQLEDKTDHESIRTDHRNDLAELVEGLREEVRLRSLQGKDVEANQKDVRRLERRITRIEDRR